MPSTGYENLDVETWHATSHCVGLKQRVSKCQAIKQDVHLFNPKLTWPQEGDVACHVSTLVFAHLLRASALNPTVLCREVIGRLERETFMRRVLYTF